MNSVDSSAFILPTVLEKIHMQTAMDELIRRGHYTLNEWDATAINMAAKAAWNEHNDGGKPWLDYGDIGYDEPIIEQGTRNKPAYRARILGFNSFTLSMSGVSLHYVDELLFPIANGESHRTYSATVLAPVKTIDIQLHTLGNGASTVPESNCNQKNRAKIYIAPDMPPTAVHYDDITYVANKLKIDDEDTKLLSRITALLGTEAVEVLSNDSCISVISALHQATKSLRSS